ncbi:hypothetical protein Kpol_526p39 [Vanderwaltozyma polyspora DSM 70294]|uniref:Tryptophan--tRNA ligase, mitochondrial n=1 Tax=Vanderwaltozyma polyspora (strain ATCC 22028 / DSM 70294 / BCRC 21397 / CBS 2163 / NBRC 10782 / NRRL Y-8283 / UCD 57-17) TaxID=436907 RepID=A7TLU4_VANPO|nr:uncharacterized protein Kpol_526p39 [Vanderwaltozyma polyspora DSM 70294]EDO16786.1 hypothetical protein Kpol_526p39 [Vanderwaltozyma polyspora DSM 70294]
MMLRRSIPRLLVHKRFSSASAGTIQQLNAKLSPKDIPDEATVFSMIQPTGKFHLGNYLGATRAWKDLSDLQKGNQKIIFGVADLHAITIPKPDAAEFRRFRKEAIASILSVGIDPSKVSVMYQSQIPEHSQLHWLLSTFASMGSLNRMNQWKSKSNIKEVDNETIGKVKLGLFSYPVLQAADILLYRSTHVPVGDDQAQHLELTRTLAEQFNNTYNVDFFPIPTTVFTPTSKILSLNSPDKKMSKSDPNQQSVIYLTDEPDVIKTKVKKAVTDSISESFNYDPIKRPGLSNLMNIVSGIQRAPIDVVESEFQKFNNYRDVKNYVSEVIIEDLKGPREEYKKLIQDEAYLDKIINEGQGRARDLANKNVNEIMKIMGFN